MASRWTWRVGQGGVLEEARSESVPQNEQGFMGQIWPFVSHVSHPSTCLEFLFHLRFGEQFWGNTPFLSRDGKKVAILFVQGFSQNFSVLPSLLVACCC